MPSPFLTTFKKLQTMEMPGIEPGAFHMQSERATTALHPQQRKVSVQMLIKETS